MKKKYFEPTTETAPLFLSANIMSGEMAGSNIDDGNNGNGQSIFP